MIKEVILEKIKFESGKITLNTNDIDWFGKSYIVFNLDNPITTDSEITKLFDCITFSFNGVKSSLSSEFILILLKLYTNENIIPLLNKMLIGNTVYIPLGHFFYGTEMYVKAQLVEIEINGLDPKLCSSTDFFYEKIIKEGLPNQVDLQIPIKIFSIKTYNLETSFDILDNNVQEIFWIYRDLDGNQINPVDTIRILSDKHRLFDTLRREPVYWTYVTQYSYHTNSNSNPNLYLYSFAINPENSQDHTSCDIPLKIEQDIKEDLVECKQIVCVKSICWVTQQS
jgi:hypothetical protein